MQLGTLSGLIVLDEVVKLHFARDLGIDAN